MLFYVEIVMNVLFENKSYSSLSKGLFQFIYLITHLTSFDLMEFQSQAIVQ